MSLGGFGGSKNRPTREPKLEDDPQIRDFLKEHRAACVRWVGEGWTCLVCRTYWTGTPKAEHHREGCPMRCTMPAPGDAE